VAHGNESLEYILQTGVVGHFVFEQLDQNRTAFKGLQFEQFQVQMKANDFYLKQFEKYLSKLGIEIDLNKNKAIVNRYIVAELARQLYGESQYYQIVLKEDLMIKAVLKE